MKLKHLSADGLYKNLKDGFSKIDDPRKRQIIYSLEDTFLTAMSAFSLKYDSFNCFYSELDKHPQKRKNIRNLFKIESVPSMTRIKEILDPIPTSALRNSFKNLFESFQRSKRLTEFKFMNRYLLAYDGVQYFQSQKISCKHCMVKNKKNGTHYYHQMLAGCIVNPEIKQVIPVFPEPIQNDDGFKKNDCERNAAMRFFDGLKKDHPRLPFIVTGDGLSSNAPLVKKLQQHDMRFILGAKPGGNKSLFNYIEGLKLKELSEITYSGKKVKKRTTKNIRFVNGVPLNDSHPDLLVNFVYLEEVHEKEVKGEWMTTKISTFSWVTDIEVIDKNVFQIAKGGRKRWAIENETFNTLKNQNYNFEHNYGHGEDHLGTNLAVLMMLTFLVDQLQEYSCSTFQKLKDSFSTKKTLWWKVKCYFELLNIESDWHGFFNYLINFQVLDDTC